MAQLSANLARSFELGDFTDLPVAASAVIYEGSAVGIASGYARQLNAGDLFAGFAHIGVPVAPAANGDLLVRVRRMGLIVLTITSVAVTDIGKPVYASDGDTFTLTSGSNSHIGRVVRVIAANTALVAFDADAAGLGTVAPLTDNSGGTAGDTIAAIGSSYVQAEVRNAIASLAARVNALAKQFG
ncbi:capsid cement protein [Roseococcus microcysteis]|uniref:capsid cement protein n=1 Tax=Roseococcus microcysteis TaxID=2771361 RepID=UPI00168A7396|nr:capsid cement protein [Roseococcus microcysteis]